MNNKYKIYCITNRINNKKYIGVTKNDLKERVSKGYYNNYEFNKDIHQFGWNNFEKKIIDMAKNKCEADKKEKYYIKIYDTINNGYNIQTGGFKDYEMPLLKGKHNSKETEFKNGNISIRRKKVICIENNEIYDSVSEAQKLTNSFHIGDVCNGKRKKSNNLTWRWYCES